MADRLLLQEELEDVLGSANVYFQPPESIKLEFPCIIYKRNRPYNQYADNLSYLFMNSYNILYIDSDPDNDMTERMRHHFSRLNIGSPYVADGRYHHPFDLYY